MANIGRLNKTLTYIASYFGEMGGCVYDDCKRASIDLRSLILLCLSCFIVGALVVVMIMGFFAAGFLNQAALLHASVMALPFDFRVSRTPEYATHGFTESHVSHIS